MINHRLRSVLTGLAATAALATAALLGFAGSAAAANTTIAVAANFTEPAREIAAAFEKNTGETVTLSFGSTGQFTTQIQQDAPFSVLLAADAETPKSLIAQGLAVAGSDVTYAIGQLVLWSKTPSVVANEATLRSGAFEKLAIANPKLAPYGAAAIQTLSALGIHDTLAPKLVQGTSITQAFQFVDTGNAELGFVALSQVITKAEARYWLVPQALYTPIRQNAVLLRKGQADGTAQKFLKFLKGPEALAVIKKYGYVI